MQMGVSLFVEASQNMQRRFGVFFYVDIECNWNMCGESLTWVNVLRVIDRKTLLFSLSNGGPTMTNSFPQSKSPVSCHVASS